MSWFQKLFTLTVLTGLAYVFGAEQSRKNREDMVREAANRHNPCRKPEPTWKDHMNWSNLADMAKSRASKDRIGLGLAFHKVADDVLEVLAITNQYDRKEAHEFLVHKMASELGKRAAQRRREDQEAAEKYGDVCSVCGKTRPTKLVNFNGPNPMPAGDDYVAAGTRICDTCLRRSLKNMDMDAQTLLVHNNWHIAHTASSVNDAKRRAEAKKARCC